MNVHLISLPDVPGGHEKRPPAPVYPARVWRASVVEGGADSDVDAVANANQANLASSTAAAVLLVLGEYRVGVDILQSTRNAGKL